VVGRHLQTPNDMAQCRREKSHAKSEHHDLEVNGHHVGYWIGFSNTRVLLERNCGREALENQQRYGSM
jgi:hypothetical protein